MASHSNPLFIKGGSRGYVVARAFWWHIGKKHSRWALRIPEGYEFESSVPWFARWYMSPDDPTFLKAAAIHDYLLENGYRQRFADGEWLDVARSEHAPVPKRVLAHFAMRAYRTIKFQRKGDWYDTIA